jgi:hypothetical protein
MLSINGLWSLVSGHIWGITAILLALMVSGLLVRHYRKPGQMTVLEAQSMDMSGAKAPVGAVPVKTDPTVLIRQPAIYLSSAMCPIRRITGVNLI